MNATTTTMIPEPLALEESLRQYGERYARVVNRLIEKGYEPNITTFIIANDLVTAEDWAFKVRSGDVEAEDVVWRVGSYARLDWAIKHCSPTFVVGILPRLWVSSDPDDTKPAYLNLWRRAFKLNRSTMIYDKFPLAGLEPFTVYRGQSASDPVGISWSLTRRVAEEFAAGAGVRRPLPDGVVIERKVKRSQILAYLMGRGEFEVIVEPDDSKEGNRS